MVRIDKSLCAGCGLCAGLCPDSFQLNLDGKAEVIKTEVSDCAKSAAENCPVGAILVK